MGLDDAWKPLYIEVKATARPDAETFIISAGELAFALRRDICHRLYHVRDVLSATPEIRIFDMQSLVQADLVRLDNQNLRVVVLTQPGK